jgi:hypothetical protein
MFNKDSLKKRYERKKIICALILSQIKNKTRSLKMKRRIKRRDSHHMYLKLQVRTKQSGGTTVRCLNLRHLKDQSSMVSGLITRAITCRFPLAVTGQFLFQKAGVPLSKVQPDVINSTPGQKRCAMSVPYIWKCISRK